MRDWKDQLKGLKKDIKPATAPDGGGGKPARVDFRPPNSWLEHDRKAAANVRRGGSTGAGVPGAGQARPEGVDRQDTHPGSGQRVGAGASLGAARAGAENVAADSQTRPNPLTRFRPKVDPARRLNLPDWAQCGRALQHPDDLSPSGRLIQAQIGLDFGTAFTKVAVRVGREDPIPIQWSDVTSDDSADSRCLLPGVVLRSETGEYGWRNDDGSTPISNLKLPLIDPNLLDDCPAATLSYLALVVRYARAYLYRKSSLARTLLGREIRWSLSIGCPTAPNENPRIVEKLRRVANTAWRLAADDTLTPPAIEAAWRRQDVADGLEDLPSVVPEFVAQIAGYLKQRPKAGLHALIDVGAATVDVATFNVVLPDREDPSPRIPILFSAVKFQGTHFLQERRHTRLGLEPSWDDGVPVDPTDEFAARHGIDRKRVMTVDAELEKEVATSICNMIDGTRTNDRGAPAHKDRLSQYPKGSVWRDGLPLFLTGGGADFPVYRNAVKQSRGTLVKRDEALRHFQFNEVDPLGARRHGLPKAVARRLSVAIGLTEDAESIGRIIPHHQMPPPSRPNPEPPRPSHEEIYGDG